MKDYFSRYVVNQTSHNQAQDLLMQSQSYVEREITNLNNSNQGPPASANNHFKKSGMGTEYDSLSIGE